ncbi:thermonuclease family protein [Mesotoga sp. BH458_6_3_2_1]|uniref:thermonuclease family protein n=1 Tax=Mesotoga sp. BH458_6_3_2_1 TaxID=1437446 RepID=UPI000EF1DE0D|nr:thermonuclease family protein [Mesotoga sp. BH458_6_3_2_1]RLL82400.1 hypothetical protein Y697_07565 [Mesotoga sp. BH458_6_3_2_1]
MRRTIFFLLFALHTLVFGLEPITLQIGDTSASYYREYLNLFDDISEYESAVICTVVDGDTVKLKLKSDPDSLLTARLIGVDTPESVHPQKSVEHFGIESSGFTKAVLEGKDVFLSFDWEQIDSYGRILCYIWIPLEYEGRAYNIMFNLLLITSGYGHAYTSYAFDENYTGIFIEAERLARLGGFNLWQEEKPDSILLPEYDPIVYITSTGDKYHVHGCHFLEHSKIPILLSEAVRRGYIPCRVCKPPQLELPSISVVEEDFLTAITVEGSVVILYPDGTWEFEAY